MKTIKLAVLLALVSALSAGCLSYVYDLTNPIIIAQAKEREQQQLQAIYGENAVFTDYTEGLEDYKLLDACFEAKQDGVLLGYVYKVVTTGYGGDIIYLLAISPEGECQNYLTLDVSTETSGFGSRVGTDEMRDKIVHKNLGDKVDTLSGATISSTAVVKGISQAAKHFEEHLKGGAS